MNTVGKSTAGDRFMYTHVCLFVCVCVGGGGCMSKCTCMFVSGELIVNRYLAESITTDAGHSSHVGLHARVLNLRYCSVRLVTNGAK